MNAQQYYWDTFSTIKRDQIYVRIMVERLDHTERCLNIFAAVSSSSAIAGWALWQNLSFVWAMIIAASQVYAAVKNHLPFGSRLKALDSLYPDIESLAHQAEEGWFKVARGTLTEDEIINLATQLTQDKIDMAKRHLKGVVSPEKPKIAAKADTAAIAYMNRFMEL